MNARRFQNLGLALLVGLLAAGCGGPAKKKTAAPATPGAPADSNIAIPEAPPAEVVSPEIAGRLSEGQREAAAGNVDAARAAYEAAASADRAAPEPHYNLGVLEERQGRYAGARRHYDDALAAKPEFGPAVAAIGMMMFRQGDRQGGLSFAQERLSRAPDSPSLRNAVSRLKLYGGDVEGAIRDATAVLRIDEKNVEAMKLLAASYGRQGKNELAAAILRSAQALDPEDPEIFAKLARAHEAMAERPKARLALEKAIALPGGASAEVYNDLGLMYHEAGDYAGAEGMFRQALSRWPDFLAAQVNLGNALKGQQKYADADAAMKRALEMSPSSADVLFNLGILYLDGQLPGLEPVGRLQSAVDYFQRYKQQPGRPAVDPVDQYIAEATKRMDVERKKAESARKEPKAAPPPASEPPAVAPSAPPADGAPPGAPGSDAGPAPAAPTIDEGGEK